MCHQPGTGWGGDLWGAETDTSLTHVANAHVDLEIKNNRKHLEPKTLQYTGQYIHIYCPHVHANYTNTAFTHSHMTTHTQTCILEKTALPFFCLHNDNAF